MTSISLCPSEIHPRANSMGSLPPHMRGSGKAIYNDPSAMFPMAAKLFNSMRTTAAGTQLNIEKPDVEQNPALAARRASFLASHNSQQEEQEEENTNVPKFVLGNDNYGFENDKNSSGDLEGPRVRKESNVRST